MRFNRLLMALFSAATLTTQAQNLTQEIDDLLGDVVGGSVLVLDQGEVVFDGSYGVTDLETNTPVTRNTNFRLASVSKQFTATAVLRLVDRGLIDLDDPITRFFPEFPAYGTEITVRHLLQHRSGLPDYEDLIPKGTTLQLNDLDALRLLMKTEAPLFDPGSEFKYSNSGYVLLGLIVEQIASQPFQDFMREEVFTPARMDGSVMFVHGLNTVPHRAYGHVQRGGNWVAGDQSMTSALRGDGVVYSSTRDLARWVAAHDAGVLLKPETTQQMLTPTAAPARNAGYGFGWFISTHREHLQVYHSGSTRGFRLGLMRFPERRAAVIVLLNCDRKGSTVELCEQIADLVLFDR